MGIMRLKLAFSIFLVEQIPTSKPIGSVLPTLNNQRRVIGYLSRYIKYSAWKFKWQAFASGVWNVGILISDICFVLGGVISDN